MGGVLADWSADLSWPISQQTDEMGSNNCKLQRMTDTWVHMTQYYFFYNYQNRLWCYCTFQTNNKEELYVIKMSVWSQENGHYFKKRWVFVFLWMLFVIHISLRSSLCSALCQEAAGQYKTLKFSQNLWSHIILTTKLTFSIPQCVYLHHE